MTLDPEYTRERVLWLTVLKLAQADASGEGFASSILQHLAQRWLTTPHRDFDTVISHAGLTPEQGKLIQQIERTKWIDKPRIN